MKPNDNTEVVCQHQMVVAGIRLRHRRKQTFNLPHKNSKLFLIKNPNNLIIIKIIKMILIIIVITATIIIILITIIITKCWNTCRTLTAPNTELSVTQNRPKAANTTKSSTSDAAWVLYAPLKRLIHYLTWWIG